MVSKRKKCASYTKSGKKCSRYAVGRSKYCAAHKKNPIRKKPKKSKRATPSRKARKRAGKSALDGLQWRVSNSLLILVIGLMFLGYGISQMGGETAIAYQVLPGDEATCQPPQPPPSEWSECINGVQKRVVYTCDEETGRWAGSLETRECEERFKEIPIAYVFVGVVFIALAGVSLLMYKQKYKAAREPQTW